MIVVADSSPLHYLILIEQVGLLRQLYSEVVIPEAVFAELSRPASSAAVSGWLSSAPSWLRLVPVSAEEIAAVTESLDVGERAAIALAETMRADLLLIDEAAGRREASRRHIRSLGRWVYSGVPPRRASSMFPMCWGGFKPRISTSPTISSRASLDGG
jgi:predicted nucleic acid-binding protein